MTRNDTPMNENQPDILIRPSQGNRGMEVMDPAIREQMREVTYTLLGEGEPLA